jgi:predicted phosphoadenosine phosphosulfate sulfurtransferase
LAQEKFDSLLHAVMQSMSFARGKTYLNIDVLTASKERIQWVFDNFERIYVSFSGGKDSTVMLHLVMDEAIKRNEKVGVLFLDWECQFTLTISHIREMYQLYEKNIEPYWVAIPIRTWNGCSQFEPEWIAWDESKKDLWVREKEPMSIKDKSYFPFYYPNMLFEEFTPLFAKWYSQGKKCACFVGIRTVESLNRYRTIVLTEKPMLEGKSWTTNVVDDVWNVYPIYDWQTEDDWIYVGKYKKKYNHLYDRMHQAGLTISQMRIDEPFGDTQRRGLWLYQIIEPQLWAKMCIRVAGANTGALYSKERGNILGNDTLKLPEGHTWESFANFLLETMPPGTAEHYKNKIAVFLNWYRTRGYPDNIPDDSDIKSKTPSWKLICKSLLRNDYWCRGIGFSPTKSAAYQKYLELMKKRRNNWQIFPVGEEL